MDHVLAANHSWLFLVWTGGLPCGTAFSMHLLVCYSLSFHPWQGTDMLEDAMVIEEEVVMLEELDHSGKENLSHRALGIADT